MSEHSSGGGPEWWLGFAHLNENERALLQQRRAHSVRLVMSIVLIGGGVLLFLSNLGVIALPHLYLLWPLLPMVGGFAALTNRRSAGGRVWGAFLILFGALFVLLNFGWIHIHTNNGTWPLALLLLAAGFAALFSVLESSRRGDSHTSPHAPDYGPLPHGPSPQEAFVHRAAPPPRPVPQYAPRPPVHDSMSDYVVLGALKRKVESHAFQGGEMTTIFGNIEVDLRNAGIAAPATSAVLSVTAIFGSAKLRVPRDWRVHINGTSVFANFEDKTIPPNTGLGAPTLVITGWSIFSSIEIED